LGIDLLEDVVRQQKSGNPVGAVSVCSSHPHVIRATLRRALSTDGLVLIESTCNQVNQHGGYTGLTPDGFRRYVGEIAGQVGIPMEQVLLGGDHLGPYAWRDLPADQAMQEAGILVRDYVRAGLVKIHLDASMPLADDDRSAALPAEIAASRAARLARVAEEACSEARVMCAPRYVIGTEVPTPGGATGSCDALRVTAAAEAQATIDLTREAFRTEGIAPAWDRVLALVVQPGVEFGDNHVHRYEPALAQDLMRLIAATPGMVYEVHSTDYQLRSSLHSLVHDHFAILKVGPALTFAFREMAFALAAMENELLTGPREPERSNLVGVLDSTMRTHPEHWQGHYHGTDEALAFARKYSLSDRARYYWADKSVQAALARLMENLRRTPPPLSLLSQFAPVQCARVREERLENTPSAIILDGIEAVLSDYEHACQGQRS
jgi:D-tagatose-1,6-bisphosphate aldolase subunit GatZ/KbaZ